MGYTNDVDEECATCNQITNYMSDDGIPMCPLCDAERNIELQKIHQQGMEYVENSVVIVNKNLSSISEEDLIELANEHFAEFHGKYPHDLDAEESALVNFIRHRCTNYDDLIARIPKFEDGTQKSAIALRLKVHREITKHVSWLEHALLPDDD